MLLVSVDITVQLYLKSWFSSKAYEIMIRLTKFQNGEALNFAIER